MTLTKVETILHFPDLGILDKQKLTLVRNNKEGN